MPFLAEAEPVIKKKKRAYANAYTRKGEGFAAAVEALTSQAHPTNAEAAEKVDESAKRRRIENGNGMGAAAMKIEGDAGGFVSIKPEVKLSSWLF